MKVFILGLRRSGTTIFWEMFRQDSRFTCYDEPFNRLLIHPDEHPKKVRKEFIILRQKDPATYWKLFSPIDSADEVREGLNHNQIEWLKYLLNSSSNVLTDMTRCHHKLASLKEHFPHALIIHLHRAPASFTTSHMFPSDFSKITGFRTLYKNIEMKKSFWSRTDKYNYWQIEEIIGPQLRGPFGIRMREELGLKEDEDIPAAAKLLAYWRIIYEKVEKDGHSLFGENFFSVRFEDFCHSPKNIIEIIYKKINMPLPMFDFSRVHPSNRSYREGHFNWYRMARLSKSPTDNEYLFR